VLGLFQVSGTAEALGQFDLKYIGYWSHIGGFVFGMAAAWAIAMRKAPARPRLSRSGLRRKALIDVAQRFESLTLEDGDDPFGYAELGRVWALMGDQSRSAANYLKAIELYRRDGNRDEALAALRAALKFWPETTLSHAALFRFICFFEALGEYEEAASRFAWLTSAAHGEPEAEMALLKLGQVQLDRLGRPDLAIEPLNRLLLEFPNSEWADLARQLLGRAGASGE
jgi:tetratricopeptide (TPR) repeat protein